MQLELRAKGFSILPCQYAQMVCRVADDASYQIAVL